MAGRSFKERLKADQKMIGVWSLTGSADVVEILAEGGFDFVVIDHEHGQGSVESAVSQLRALKGSACAGIVRVPTNDPIYIKRILDIGVDGIMVPNILTAEQAAKAVSACRYPPAGSRGAFSGMRANRYGLDVRYHLEFEDRTAIIVQVEHQDAIGHIDRISKIEGLDAIFIGPRDLSASLGKLNLFADEAVINAIDSAEKAIKLGGKPMGSTAFGADRARQMLGSGYTFVISGSDTSIIAQSSAQIVQTATGKN